MKNFFDFVAPIYERLHISAEKTFKKIEEIGNFSASDTVVDIGGGTGRIARFLVGKVKKITVIDPSRKMIEQCRKHSGINCVIADGEKIPLGNDSADKIIIVDAFHHISGKSETITEIKRILRQNGKVIIEEFNPLTFYGKLIVIFEKILRLNSVFYEPSALADLFSKNGFKVNLFDEKNKSYYISAEKI